MPNIKSAKKRVEIGENNRLANRAYKSELATALKKFNAAVTAGDKELVKKLYPATVSILDESVTRGVIHKNKADRKKAEVSSKYIAVATAKKAKPAAAPKVEEKPAEEKEPEVKKPAKAPAKKAAAKKEEVVEAKPKKAAAKKTAEPKEAKPAEKKTTKKAAK